MKKVLFFVACAAIGFTAAWLFKPAQSYPLPTAETVVKAKIKIRDLASLEQSILIQGNKLRSGKLDTAQQRKSMDTLVGNVNFIDSIFGDTTLNPVFKKSN